MTIRKSGHMDSARSHVQGLLPYVLPDSRIHEVAKGDYNGNFGQYVCDFGIDGGNPGREAGTDLLNNYTRFRYLDFARSYAYAKKQIREGILVKYLGSHEVQVGLECDGSPRMEEREVWSYKFEENPEAYGYTPFNYYGKDKNNHRTVENYAKEGDYGLIFTNGNTDDKPTVGVGEFALLVGASMDGDGTVYPNQDRTYRREEESDPESVFWEYPDTAGKIESDSGKWIGFGIAFSDDDYWSICKDMEERFVGYLTIPQSIKGDLVPDRIAYADIPEWIDWFNRHSKDSCCYEKIVDGDDVNVGNVVDKEWTDRGGDEMRGFLAGKENLLEQALEAINSMGCVFLVPNMEFPLLLTNEYRGTGLWTEYVDENGETAQDSPAETPEAGWADLEDKNLMVESQLQSVRSSVYHSDDNGVLPGLFDEDGGYYKCLYRNYWEYKEYLNPSDEEKEEAVLKDSVPPTGSTRFDDYIIKVVDGDEEKYYKEGNVTYTEVVGIGEPSNCRDDYKAVNDKDCYFTATVVEEAVPILNTLVPLKEGRGLVDGDFVNLLAKFKTPLRIPYIEKEVHNFYDDGNGRYYGDYVTHIKETGSQITIEYRIGGKCNEDGTCNDTGECGILLRDTYVYEPEHSYSCSFEGYPTVIKGEYIDFGETAISVENDDFGVTETDENGEETFVPKTRICNQAQILGMRLMDVLGGLESKIMFKQPETDGLEFPIKSEVDIELNRGSSAAFENYFKLSECNTMQDLENYQNNWFNL